MAASEVVDFKDMPGTEPQPQAVEPVKPQPLSRDAFLSHLGELAEEDVDVPGLGVVRVREITGAQRADLLGVLIPAAPADGKPPEKPNFALYQELLLRLGLVDPQDGQPLLDVATAPKVMREMGAAKVAALAEAVERVSGLSSKTPERAEGNSGSTPSSASTSG